MRCRGLLAFVTVASLLAIPASAHAGTVQRLLNPDEEYDAVWFNAEPGESNRVTAQVAAKTVTIADTGAPLTVDADSGCTLVDEHTARCPRRPDLAIYLGDLDDRARLAYSAPARRDYAGVYGESGDDVLTGSPRADTLDGGPGADVIDGGAGNDELTGGEGPDVLRGGPGRDLMNVHDYNGAPTDRIACGAGRDTLNPDIDAPDIVHRDCEAIATNSPSGRPLTPTFASGGDGTYRAPCTRIGNNRSSRCTAHIVLTDRAGRRLAEGRGAIRTEPYRAIRMRWSQLQVAVHLTPVGRRILLGGRHVVIRVRVDLTESVPGLSSSHGTLRYRVAWR